MKRLVAVTILLLLSIPGVAVVSASAADPVVHDLDVTGPGVSMYPTFARSTARYAMTTTEATRGTVTVTASTSDPAGRVLVNGRTAPGGVRTLTGLRSGDEIAVFVSDSTGTATYSLIYLPVGFPALARDRSGASQDTPSPGLVMLTLGLWTQPSSFYETAVDANGVPAVVQSFANSMDFTRLDNGHYSVARGTGDATGAEIVELDEQFREVGRYRTVGLTHTDGHDSILLPDGSRYLLAYEPNEATGKTDAIIQHIGPGNAVLFEWNSADHVDIPAETVVPGNNPDYAHVNSIEIMDDGDLLVSFRHFSSVFKIARTAHDGYARGEVVWKLGGRDSDFTFTDTTGAPDGGPCAQHTATELANGNIVVFDNGAWTLNPLCIDPADPAGAPVARVPTRIAEWSLDEGSGEATMVKDHQVSGRYAIFAGSAQRLDNGNTVAGWASSTAAVASEIDPAGNLLWDLTAVDSPKYFTYRAMKTVVPDAIAPVVSVSAPGDGQVYPQGSQVAAIYDCTDRGGSSLRTCASTAIDTTTPGTRTFTVSGTDGAGSTTSVRRTYTVTAAPVVPTDPPAVPPTTRHQPDAMIRTAAGRFRGRDSYGARPPQRITSEVRRSGRAARAVVRIQNDGTVADRFTIGKVAGSQEFGLSYRFPGKHAISPMLSPGESWTFRIDVVRKAGARSRDDIDVKVVARSRLSTSDRDVVWFRVRAR